MKTCAACPILTMRDWNRQRCPRWGSKKRKEITSFLLVSRNETLQLHGEMCVCGLCPNAAHECTLYRRYVSELSFPLFFPRVASRQSGKGKAHSGNSAKYQKTSEKIKYTNGYYSTAVRSASRNTNALFFFLARGNSINRPSIANVIHQ